MGHHTSSCLCPGRTTDNNLLAFFVPLMAFKSKTNDHVEGGVKNIITLVSIRSNQKEKKKGKRERKKKETMGKFIFSCYDQSLLYRNTQ
jgi:hypothetical protein